MDPLAGIVAKVDRGMHHLKVVERGTQMFLDHKTWEVTFEDDTEPKDGYNVTDPDLTDPRSPPPAGRWQLARLRIHREAPLSLSIRVGEAFGQFASSLDHLMTELVGLKAQKYVAHPEKSPNFPIYEKPGSFWNVNAETGKVPAESVRKYVGDKHFAELERLQPAKVEDLRPVPGQLSIPLALAVIKGVNNFHKHATLRPSIVATQRVSMRANRNVVAFRDWYVPGAPIYDEAKLYSAIFVSGPEVGVPMTIEPTLKFGVPDYAWVNIGTIRRCGESVRDIVARFREITPEFRSDAHDAPPGKPNV